MKMTTELNKESIENLLEQYKVYSVPVLAIVIAVLMFFILLVPQINSFSEKKNQRDTEMEKLTSLEKAVKVVSAADMDAIDTNLSKVNAALPSDKNYENCINAINTAASKSNVTVQDFSLQPEVATIFPSIVFQMRVLGTPNQVINYINNLYETFPIAEVTAFSGGPDSSTLEVYFYYKGFDPASSEGNMAVRDMNSAESGVLTKISGWDTSVVEYNNASSSAGTRTSPFE